VSPLLRRLGVVCLVSAPLVVAAFGCGQQTPAPVPTVVTEQASPAAGEVELSDPKVALLKGEDLVEFKVKYRFTKGRPDKHYSCNISFPGTANHGVKQIESWELQSEGVIHDRIKLSEPGVKTFEITMLETPSPQEGYQKISNVVSGSVE
jgi:hypothetical protein